MSDLAKDPIVMWQKKYYPFISILMCFAVPSNFFLYLAFIYWFFVHLPILAAFAISMLNYAWTLNATWCVNSVCHFFGSRPWNNKI